MRVTIQVESNVYRVAGAAENVDGIGCFEERLLNSISLVRTFSRAGYTPITLPINIRNNDWFIPRELDLWGAVVTVEAIGETWSGQITGYEYDMAGVLYITATEKTAPELSEMVPDEVVHLFTVSESTHQSAMDVTLPLVAGGTVAEPILVKGILYDKINGIYLFSVGENRQVVKVYSGTEEMTEGFVAYTGTADQALHPGFCLVQITDPAKRKNDDGSYVSISADIVGLKLGNHTLEECRNGARFLLWFLKTAKSGTNAWGLGISESDIDLDSFADSIAKVDAAGLKMDGIFYFRQQAQSWIDQICNAIRGRYRINKNGKRTLFVDAPASSVKTYSPALSNIKLLQYGKGAYVGRVYNKGRLEHSYNPITGQFMQSDTYENATSIAKIDEQKFIGQSYLLRDPASAKAILDYTCKKSETAAWKVLFETLELPDDAADGQVITVDHPAHAITGLFQIVRIQITDFAHTIEAERYSVNDFVSGTPGATIAWTKDAPISSAVNPGQASGLVLASEVRPSPDGSNIVVLTGRFTPPTGGYLAASVEYAQGILPILDWTDFGLLRGSSFEIAPVEPGQPYAVRIRMMSPTGKSDFITGTITVQGDDIPPGTPTISASSYLKAVRIAIALAAVPSDMCGFKVYRNTTNNPDTAAEIGSIDAQNGTAVFPDTAPAYGMTYYYWAKAYDTWKNLSAFSSVASTEITAISGTDIVDGALSRSALFAAGVVDATAIATKAITNAKLANDAVNTAQIAAGAITELKLANDAVTAAKLNVAAIDGVSGNIVTGAVGELQLAANAVTAAKIKAGEVGSTALATGAITELKLANNAVTAAKLNVAGIDSTTGAVASGAVAELQLAAAAVTAPKIANGAVTAEKMLIGKAGAALNDDPNFEDPSAWISYGDGLAHIFATVTDGKVGNNVLRSATNAGSYPFTNKYYALDPSKTYRVRAWVRKSSTSNGVLYMCWQTYNSAGAKIPLNAGYYIVNGQTPATTWTEYAVLVGAGTAWPASSDARSMKIGLLLNFGANAGYMEAQDFRLEEVLPSTLIQDGAIITDKLAAGAVTAAKITSGELITLTAQIKDAVITSAKIDSLDAAKITTGTLAAARIAAGSLAADKITGGALVIGSAAGDVNAGVATINGGKITASSVTASQLASDSVTTDKLAAGSVTAAKVTSGELITLTAQIKNAVVTSAKISALDAAKITTGTLAAERIAAGSLAADKITGGAIVVGGAAGDVNSGATTIAGGKITAGSITATQIAADAVTADKIYALSVTSAKIAARAVTAEKILVGKAGAALNDDPNFEDPSAWMSSSGLAYIFATVTDGKVGSNVLRSATNAGSYPFTSKYYALDPSKTYRVRAWVRKSSTSNGLLYMCWQTYNSAGTKIPAYEGYYVVAGAVPNSTWTEYSALVGAGTAYPATSDARTMRIGMLLNFNGSVGYMEAQDFRLEEVLPATLIQDGAIITDKLAANAVTAAKVSAGAIETAALAAGAVTADKVSAGAITSDKLTSSQIVGKDIRTAANVGNGTVSGLKMTSAGLEGWAGPSRQFFLANNGWGNIFGFSIIASSIWDADCSYTSGANTLRSQIRMNVPHNLDASGAVVPSITIRREYNANVHQCEMNNGRLKTTGLEGSNNSSCTIGGLGQDGSGANSTAHQIITLQSTSYLAFYTNASIYIGNNCSALSFTDRTEMPESMDEALEIINTMQPTKGKVDYKRLSNKAKKFTIQKAEDGSEYIEEGRDLTKTVSALVMICQKLQEENIRLSDRLTKLEAPAPDEEREYDKIIEKIIEENRAVIRERLKKAA